MRRGWRSVVFPDPDDRMNENDSRGRTQAASIQHTERVRAWRDAGFLCGRNGRRPRITGKATVTVMFGTDRPNQRRDPMNFYPTVKALIDGLTTAGFWPDDDARHVLVAQPIFTADIKPRHFVIHVEWHDPEETS